VGGTARARKLAAPFASTEPEGTARARGAAPFRVAQALSSLCIYGRAVPHSLQIGFGLVWKLRFPTLMGSGLGQVLPRNHRVRACPTFSGRILPRRSSTASRGALRYSGLPQSSQLSLLVMLFPTFNGAQVGITRTDSLQPLVPPCQPLRGGHLLDISPSLSQKYPDDPEIRLFLQKFRRGVPVSGSDELSPDHCVLTSPGRVCATGAGSLPGGGPGVQDVSGVQNVPCVQDRRMPVSPGG
jgi:hypothetical protein